jgi:hypothetical protein
MKTRDHFKHLNFDAIEQTVWKFTQTRAMHIPKNDRELMRIFPQTENDRFNFFAKARPQAGTPVLVPILGPTSSARAAGVKITCIATGGGELTRRATVPR